MHPEPCSELHAEIQRLRYEVASLRATLGMSPAADGAEPIGCPAPGMCAAVDAVAREREACAKVADDAPFNDAIIRAVCRMIAETIRARGHGDAP